MEPAVRSKVAVVRCSAPRASPSGRSGACCARIAARRTSTSSDTFNRPRYDHLRIDACDTCRYYLKAVDLTRLGLAVPIVDEVAGAPLDHLGAGAGLLIRLS